MTTRELKVKLIEAINQSKLPIDIIDLIVESLYLSIHMQAEAAFANYAEERAGDSTDLGSPELILDGEDTDEE